MPDTVYTKEDLKEQLRQMGLKPTDTVLIHSSMKAVGEVEGGADTVLDAWMEYFSEGLLLLPTHTWRQMGESYPVFDPDTRGVLCGASDKSVQKASGGGALSASHSQYGSFWKARGRICGG